jgi:hypothetical protein
LTGKVAGQSYAAVTQQGTAPNLPPLSIVNPSPAPSDFIASIIIAAKELNACNNIINRDSVDKITNALSHIFGSVSTDAVMASVATIATSPRASNG